MFSRLSRCAVLVFVVGVLAGCDSDTSTTTSEATAEVRAADAPASVSAEDYLPVPSDIPVMWQAQYEDALGKLDTPRGAVSLANASLAIGSELLHARKNEGYLYLVQAGETLRLAQELGVAVEPEDLSAFQYAETRGLANTKQEDAAMAALTNAVENGFSDHRAMELDPDLEPLRKRDGFEELSMKVETASKIAARKKAAEDLAAGESFPLEFSLPDIEGTQQSLEKYEGQVVVVDLWGTWCPPCRAELPTFIEMQGTYSDQGFQMIGINYERVRDEEKKLAVVEKFVAENGVNYPCVIGTEDIQNQVPEFAAFPTTLFIDRSGKVRLKAVGFKEHEYVKSVVEMLLAESP